MVRYLVDQIVGILVGDVVGGVGACVVPYVGAGVDVNVNTILDYIFAHFLTMHPKNNMNLFIQLR